MKKQGHKIHGNGGNRRSQTAATESDSAGRRPLQAATGGISKGRTELLAVLKEYGVSVQGFDALRADTYEKHLAQRSLQELEHFYFTLFTSSDTCQVIQQQLPRWRLGHKFAGKLPSLKTLLIIKQRIMAGQTADDLTRHLEVLQSFKERITGLPKDRQVELFDLMLALVGEEVIKAKFNGKPLTENLKVVDLLRKTVFSRARQELLEARLKLDEQVKLGRLKLDQEKQAFDNQKEKKGPKDLAVGQQAPKPGLTGEKIEEVLEKLYGKKPAKLQAANANGINAEAQRTQRDAEDLAVGQEAPSTEVLNHKGTENTEVLGQEKLSTTSPRPSPPIRLAERENGVAGSRERTVKAANKGEQKTKTNWGLERTLQSATQNRQVGKPALQPKAAQPAKVAKVVAPEKGWWMWRGMNKTWVPGEKPDNYDENGLEIQSHLIRKAGDQSDSPAPSLTIQQQAYLQYQVLLGNHQHAAGPHL